MKIKKISDSAIFPAKATANAAGYDIYVPDYMRVVLEPMSVSKIGTKLCFEISDGYYGQLKERSSLAIQGVTVTGGVIDSDYRGEIFVIMNNWNDKQVIIGGNDAIAQVIFTKIHNDVVVYYDTGAELSETLRSDAGFGSTNRSNSL